MLFALRCFNAFIMSHEIRIENPIREYEKWEFRLPCDSLSGNFYCILASYKSSCFCVGFLVPECLVGFSRVSKRSWLWSKSFSRNARLVFEYLIVTFVRPRGGLLDLSNICSWVTVEWPFASPGRVHSVAEPSGLFIYSWSWFWAEQPWCELLWWISVRSNWINWIKLYLRHFQRFPWGPIFLSIFLL